MEIRIRATGQVLLDHEWIKWVAKTYGKSVGPLNPEVIAMFDSDPVFEGPQATGGTVYQYSMRQGVEQQADGKWYTKYVLGPIFTDTISVDGKVTTAAEQEAAYKTIKDAEQAQSVRTDRNRRLSETDWRFRTDMNPSQAWKDYCQALRDVPSQAGFPQNVQWPTQPE